MRQLDLLVLDLDALRPSIGSASGWYWPTSDLSLSSFNTPENQTPFQFFYAITSNPVASFICALVLEFWCFYRLSSVPSSSIRVIKIDVEVGTSSIDCLIRENARITSWCVAPWPWLAIIFCCNSRLPPCICSTCKLSVCLERFHSESQEMVVLPNSLRVYTHFCCYVSPYSLAKGTPIPQSSQQLRPDGTRSVGPKGLIPRPSYPQTLVAVFQEPSNFHPEAAAELFWVVSTIETERQRGENPRAPKLIFWLACKWLIF